MTRLSFRIAAVRLALAIVALTALVRPASAHFLWIVAGEGSPDGKAHVYFSESAAPDDATLLDKVAGAKVWASVRKGRDVEFVDLSVGRKDPAERSLYGELPKGAEDVGLTHTYGVISRGGQTFQLRYSARAVLSAAPSSWRKVGDASRAPLEVVPRWSGGGVELTVLWKGEPVAGSEVAVSGGGLDETKLVADGEGRVRVEPKKPGLLSIRARHVLEEKGEVEGKAYDSVRQYATLSLPVSLPDMVASVGKFSALPRGITSFGAAVAGDALYVYGGHFGGAHHYSENQQSGQFLRLNLKDGKKWEELPGGPKRTGLAMVAHDGVLIRMGGFSARNEESKDQDLHSESDAAAFDPARNAWRDLPALPAGRSSFDAAMLDGTLYAVGGWQLRGKESSTWHGTALVCEPGAKTVVWKEIPVPFRRRALSVAAQGGKIYAIGGMQEHGGPTTRVDVYSPATGQWAEGPAILGGPMEGFGNSSFATDGRLYVTTMSGSVQRLSGDGSRWEMVGQLEQPRFFHRLLPLTDGSLVAVGGASMQDGKRLAPELLVGRAR